ncbi:hypothetical protein UlMin_026446, partial [Ulmus minor]
VGDPKKDHKCWEMPEDMIEKLPLTQVNTSSPGSDVAAESVATLASTSLVFKWSNPTYSRTLLDQAGSFMQQESTYLDFFTGDNRENLANW